MNARLDLSGRRITVSELTGSVNGGTLKGRGHVEFGTGGIADASLELTTDDVAFDAPLDLRSLSDATVQPDQEGDEFVVERPDHAVGSGAHRRHQLRRRVARRR